MTKSSEFTNKTILVTGAAAGIGRAVCLALAAQGALVYAGDVNVDGLARLESDAPSGNSITPVSMDVSQAANFEIAINQIVKEHGRLDMIINNAGIVLGGDFDATSMAEIERIVNINLWGVIYGTKLGYAQMRKQGFGHIANVSSSAGMMPVPNSTMYAAIKHAIVGLSHSLREEAALHGIEISTILPGMVQSDLWENAVNAGNYDYKQRMKDTGMTPMSSKDAATAILDGISKNKRSIIFPRFNRVILRLYQLAPNFMTKLAVKRLAEE